LILALQSQTKDIMKRIQPFFSASACLLLLLISLAGCTGGSSSEVVKPPLKGAVKPKEPVIRRSSQKFDNIEHPKQAALKADFDYQLMVGGKSLAGKQSLACTLVQADKGKLSLRGPQQEEIRLAYRLDTAHAQVQLPAGTQRLQVDALETFVQGALKRHIVVSEAKGVVLAILNGGDAAPLRLQLPGGVTLAQQAMDPTPARSDAHASYHAVPLQVRGPGMNLVLRPGAQAAAVGLTVRVSESEARVMNPASRTGAAFAEGPAYHYQIALYR
jgi:hypothetical protein